MADGGDCSWTSPVLQAARGGGVNSDLATSLGPSAGGIMKANPGTMTSPGKAWAGSTCTDSATFAVSSDRGGARGEAGAGTRPGESPPEIAPGAASNADLALLTTEPEGGGASLLCAGDTPVCTAAGLQRGQQCQLLHLGGQRAWCRPREQRVRRQPVG